MNGRPTRFRPAVRPRLLEAVKGSVPLMLAGPPGAGKTSLMLDAARVLAEGGAHAVYLDLMAAASCPERFVATAAGALPKACPGRDELLHMAGSGRLLGETAVRALLDTWSRVRDCDGAPLVLLLDEPTEIRSLAYFPGLREVHVAFGDALRARGGRTIVATSFPTQARRLWPGFECLELQPLLAADLEGDALLARASFGWPRYVRVLQDRGGSLVQSWTEEMSAGGQLEQMCRATYESLLLRSRGYGISKAVLALVAEHEGENLTSLVARVGRTPGATRDYLAWLMDVDALRATRRRYHYVDGMLRQWVRLHGRGTPALPDEIEAAALQILSAPVERTPVAARAARPRPMAAMETAEPVPVATADRRDTLMEID